MKNLICCMIAAACISACKDPNDSSSSKNFANSGSPPARVFTTDSRDLRVFRGETQNANAGWLTTRTDGLFGGTDVKPIGFTIKSEVAKPASDFVPVWEIAGSGEMPHGALYARPAATQQEDNLVRYISRNPVQGGTVVYATNKDCSIPKSRVPAQDIVTTSQNHMYCSTHLLGYLIP